MALSRYSDRTQLVDAAPGVPGISSPSAPGRRAVPRGGAVVGQAELESGRRRIRLLTSAEVAALLRVSLKTLYAWHQKGSPEAPPSIRMGKYRMYFEDDVYAHLAARVERNGR